MSGCCFCSFIYAPWRNWQRSGLLIRRFLVRVQVGQLIWYNRTMPLTGDRKREYQKQWLTARRDAWIAANGPCAQCGGAESLSVDHRDRAGKVSHRVWSWSQERREAELEKCQVLCWECHKKKSDEEQRVPHGGGARGRKNCKCGPCKERLREYNLHWFRNKRERVRREQMATGS